MQTAEREREYSPSSAIGGNYAPYIAAYAQLSAQAHQQVPAQRDLRYGAQARAVLDYFAAPTALNHAPSHNPDPRQRPGLLVFIHGGYWQELSKNESAFLAPAWHQAGFAHAVLGYTLAPEASVGEMVAQCVAALRWLHARAQALGFDPGRIVVAGSSAGAYLAAACAQQLSQAAQTSNAPGPRLKGLVLMSGIYDLAPLIGTSINDALGLNATSAAALDLSATATRLPPALVLWGEVETQAFKQQSLAFAAQLRRNNTTCQTLEVRARNHFDVVHELGQAHTLAFQSGLRLFV